MLYYFLHLKLTGTVYPLTYPTIESNKHVMTWCNILLFFLCYLLQNKYTSNIDLFNVQVHFAP